MSSDSQAVSAPDLAPTSNNPDTGFFRVLEFFRIANAEGLNLRKKLAAALDQATSDETAFRYACVDLHPVILAKCEEAKTRTSWVEEIRRHDPEDPAWFAREFVLVRNSWDELQELWSGANVSKEPIPRLKERAVASLTLLDTLVFTCASQTIPDELSKFLKNCRIGRKLDFVETFHDQLPSDAATHKVLETLAAQSGVVAGIIDLPSGSIIKADPRFWRQCLSIGLVLAAIGLGFVLIALAVVMGKAFHFSGPDGALDTAQWATLNGAYLLMFVGLGGHWVIDRVKLERSGADATPLSEWLMWFHVNEAHLVIRVITVWLALGLGLAFKAFHYANGIEPLAFLTAGYCLDSTVDALFGRLNTFLGAKAPVKTS